MVLVVTSFQIIDNFLKFVRILRLEDKLIKLAVDTAMAEYVLDGSPYPFEYVQFWHQVNGAVHCRNAVIIEIRLHYELMLRTTAGTDEQFFNVVSFHYFIF